ncbi:hypothetical protein RFI_34575 [Reticulomyxa filosa]|uniref:Uncharacterized protein n=1 Tax=Reticulomyxa filosa TaxID=46433 RepID=X6LNW7_RETFI|nr:hypothetical protein RFI_34575 [Reticulomyxa filosa]|eukprot:ETO02837.1 hypothetical protein RFI_34575 [Reticulomyxa filosa]
MTKKLKERKINQYEVSLVSYYIICSTFFCYLICWKRDVQNSEDYPNFQTCEDKSLEFQSKNAWEFRLNTRGFCDYLGSFFCVDHLSILRLLQFVSSIPSYSFNNRNNEVIPNYKVDNGSRNTENNVGGTKKSIGMDQSMYLEEKSDKVSQILYFHYY